MDSFLIYIGAALCLMYLICKKKKDFFDPFYLFSLHYCVVYIAATVLFLRGFESNPFFMTTKFYSSHEVVFTNSLILCIVSYSFAYFGYHVFIGKRHFTYPNYVRGIKSNVFGLLGIFYFCLGFLNFLFLVQVLYGGDIVSFYKSFSGRTRELSDSGVSTVGYHFIYAAAYMFFIRWLFIRKMGLFTFCVIFISIFILASNARVIATILYIVSFIGIYYYFNGMYKLNKHIFFYGLVFILAALFLFFLRIFSNNVTHGIEGGEFSLELVLYLIFDHGNVVNFPIIMKIIDSWGRDIGYLYGVSFLYPFYGHISYDFFSLNPPVQEIIKSEWYSSLPGGNLPPTVMGEMYANFGFLGIPVGFFIFGAFGAVIKNILLITKNPIFIIFYIQFSLSFYMLVVKGGFSNLNAFWMFLPCIIFYCSILMSRTAGAIYLDP
ncbi:MAG: O-antigen polymerase [Tenuifilaceae bacterium]|nr:O-antigen polymerase [Tenuifilaceae bacterium]